VLEPFLDRTKLVNNAIHTVSKNLIEGALIVIFVLVLLLGNLRAGLLVASVIPLSMLFAVSLMHLFGVSGNLMSLGAIDFGLIVDGTVIIVEATMRHILIKRYSHRLSQAEMDQEVYESASKIRNSAAFGEIIILIVYLPILALVGIEGKMFRPMAQTVSFAILGAFILSLTYVPMISALLLSKQNEHKPSISDSIIAWFHRLYLPALTFALKRKILVVFTSFALFVSALFLFTNMGAEFIPQLDEGDFAVELRVLQGSSLSETVEVVQKAAGLIKKHFPDEVVEVVGKIGSSEIPTDPMPLEAGDVMVILKDRKMWKKAASREELAEQMQAMLVESVPGATFGFQQPIQMRFNELISGVKQDVAVKIFGEDLGVLGLQAQKIGKLAGKVEGVEDLYVEEMDGLPQIVVHFDRDKLARFGVSIARANNIINTAFAGRSAGLVYEGERRFDLVVRLDQLSRSRIEDVRKLFITNARGEHVPLDQVATVEMQRGANQIQREDAKRRITVAFNVRGRDVESIVNELKARIDREVQLPTGYFITYGGQFQNLQEANKRLVVAVPMAIFLIFILLYFTFRSLKQSLLILLAIPLSSIGGIAALWLRGMPFSISAGIGFIALFGVAVLNGIVLIGEFNQLRKEGMHDLRSIILKGTETRLRPVLMTALVASLGFLPMALSNSAGAEVQKPLATVVIGGLVSATLLTLLVLPALYIAVENWSAKRRGTAVLPLTFLGGVLFLLPATPASAQVPERRITLAQALQEASGRNLEIRSEEYQIEHFKAMQGTAVDMPRTDITWMGGQYNSLRFDNNISVSQAFAHPKVAAKKRELLGAQVSAIQDKAAMVRNEISRQVKQTYYSLVITRQKEYLLEQERLWTGRFLRAAELRFRSGETGALERSAAQAEMGDVQLRILQNTKNRKLLSSRLQMLLTSPVSVLPADDSLRRRSRFIMRADSALLTDNPYIQFIRGQAQVEQKAVSVAKTLLLPGFSAGYFNQSLIGAQNVKGTEVFFGAGKRFQGFQLGIMIPVFNGANKARIRASELNVKLAQNNVALAESQLNNALRQAMMTYEQADESLSLYEQNSLVLAEVMRNNASKAYETGEIGYLELIRAFNKALMIRLTYLDLLEAFNHSVTEIEFLLNRP
jgi:cobalt-zinc-cadmium resistance protein CzcA